MKQTKYIFVTGGVVSGLGKGITAASLGRLLKSRGLKVASQKLDPYINVDPGTMSPYQHGEVYVTEDGAETDLDLGHYERFIDENLNKYSNITSGKVYWNVLNKERRGEYLGETIQVIPHITNEIKDFIYNVGKTSDADVVITEVGGTTGDIESQPFIEAIRQVGLEVGKENAIYIHVTLLPFLSGSDEHKTKPTQHSVKELQGMGIQPDILILRTEYHLEDNLLKKVAAFCNVDIDCVFQSEDLPSIYQVPTNMLRQGLDKAILGKTGMPAREIARMSPWRTFLSKMEAADRGIRIGLVGKYDLQDAYKSIRESLFIAGIWNGVKVKPVFVSSEEITEENIGSKLEGLQGVIICPGFGSRGIEGKIIAAKYCRTHDIPTFGICLGMQMMVIEFARDVLGYSDANSREMDAATAHGVIDLMEDQKNVTQMGGTMRLGAYDCHLKEGSRAAAAYGTQDISERHRHRYEFNNAFRTEYEAAGMVCAGVNPESGLVEIVEIPSNRWYVGTQFHPEYSGTVLKPHPLFMDFIRTASGE